jgi:hypothetical protein
MVMGTNGMLVTPAVAQKMTEWYSKSQHQH